MMYSLFKSFFLSRQFNFTILLLCGYFAFEPLYAVPLDDYSTHAQIALPGAALSFDGSNDYVDLGNSTLFKPTNAVSLELWAYRADWTNIMPTSTVNKRLASVAEMGGYALFINQNSTNNIQCLVRRNGVYASVTTSASTLTAGWHHFAFTYDGRFTRLYVDGTLTGTDDAGGNYPIEYSTTTNSLLLGAEASTGNTPESNSYFQGAIDEVRIWNVARTATEIAANYACELAGNQIGLVANYHFNQGNAASVNTSITMLTDATTNTLNGTLHNFALTGSTSNWIEPGGVMSGVVCSSLAPWATNLTTSGPLSALNCTVTISGLGFGERFIFTGPQNYVYSNVFRQPVLQGIPITASGITAPGTYLLTVYLGSQSVSYTIEIGGNSCQ